MILEYVELTRFTCYSYVWQLRKLIDIVSRIGIITS